MMPPATLTLYDSRLSLNCYKVRLLLSILGIPYTRRPIDLRQGEHRTDAFLARNAFGQIPVLDTGTRCLRDSTAILVWLARTFGDERWMPRDADDEAEVHAWLQATAFELRLGPYEARLRAIAPTLCVAGDAVGRNTERALALFEARLAEAPWLVLGRPTIADIAAYPSLAHCGDGGIDLSPCPAIGAWLERVRGLPGYVGLLDL